MPQAQIHVFPPKVEKKEVKKIGDYKKKLVVYEKIAKNLYNENSYKVWKFKNKKTGTIKSLADFDEFDRKIFFLYASEKLTSDLEDLHEEWESDLKKVEETDKEDDAVTLGELIEDLQALRKTIAKHYENYIEKLHKDYADKFTNEDKKFQLKKVREYHDKHKLIERSE